MRPLACALAVALLPFCALAETPWPAWRGPLASGVAPDADPPLRWSETENVAWKTALPGTGHSTPVVWGDRVYVTTAVPTDAAANPEQVKAAEAAVPSWQRGRARVPTRTVRFAVVAIDRRDGRVAWERTVCERLPHAGTHADGSWASGSPVTDGERLYAFFGSYGLYGLDLDGGVQWSKQLGVMKTRAHFGEGASPAPCGDLLLVNWDGEGPSFLAAFDRRSGEERWRVPRDEPTSWSTPLVVVQGGVTQVVVSATNRIRAYDPADGRELWSCPGMTGNVVPCPVSDGTRVYCMSGFRGSALLAVRLAGAAGDLSEDAHAVAWKRAKDTPYVPSPLLAGGRLYYLKGNNAVLTCVDAESGAPCYEAADLEGLKGAYASPVEAAGRVYVTGRNGVTAVLKAGPTLEVLAVNTLDDGFTASAAAVGRDLFLRGHKALYCIRAE